MHTHSHTKTPVRSYFLCELQRVIMFMQTIVRYIKGYFSIDSTKMKVTMFITDQRHKVTHSQQFHDRPKSCEVTINRLYDHLGQKIKSKYITIKSKELDVKSTFKRLVTHICISTQIWMSSTKVSHFIVKIR